MAKTFRVKVEGLREVEAALQSMPKATARNIMRRILRARLEPIADTARQLVPVQFGDLKESITVGTKLSRAAKKGRQKLSPNAVEVYMGPYNAPRAYMQEFGTVKHGPQPYMRPAWDSHEGQLLDGIKEDLWAEINKAAARIARKAAKAAKAGGDE